MEPGSIPTAKSGNICRQLPLRFIGAHGNPSLCMVDTTIERRARVSCIDRQTEVVTGLQVSVKLLLMSLSRLIRATFESFFIYIRQIICNMISIQKKSLFFFSRF